MWILLMVVTLGWLLKVPTLKKIVKDRVMILRKEYPQRLFEFWLLHLFIEKRLFISNFYAISILVLFYVSNSSFMSLDETSVNKFIFNSD